MTGDVCSECIGGTSFLFLMQPTPQRSPALWGLDPTTLARGMDRLRGIRLHYLQIPLGNALTEPILLPTRSRPSAENTVVALNKIPLIPPIP